MDEIPLRFSIQHAEPLKLNSTWNTQHQGPKAQEEMERIGETAQKAADDGGYLSIFIDCLFIPCNTGMWIVMQVCAPICGAFF